MHATELKFSQAHAKQLLDQAIANYLTVSRKYSDNTVERQSANCLLSAVMDIYSSAFPDDYSMSGRVKEETGLGW